MSEMKKKLYAYNLQDTKVYNYENFLLVLKTHGLPHSEKWVRKAESLGKIPSPRLPTISSIKSAKVYTGKLIKKIIKSLLLGIENSNFAEKVV